jgi:signal-transduction protein with cAMP-binding, CBS, and nucleotidyltransferase domain
MERDLIERVDVFPYRHHVSEAMSTPPITAPADAPLAQAVRLISDRRVGSVLVVDGGNHLLGIVTEHDVVRALAKDGAAALEQKLEAVMTHPVVSVPADAFLYTALARMARRGLRQLAVDDPVTGELVGVISAGALLKERANQALMLGDEIAEAMSGAEMARIRARLPALARSLLNEKLSVLDVAAVLSAVLRDISARAAELAAASLVAEGQGLEPAAWCFLVLGSGGRGESLLAADQDNALVHAGREGEDDAWFAELGRRASDLLDAAGVPYCRGKVMASEKACRHSLEGWQVQLANWIRHPDPGALLSVDIFYDFQPVHGDRRLAEALRKDAMLAAQDRALLSRLSATLDTQTPALTMFGGFRVRQGRLDLKRGGLLPLTSAARILALKAGVAATSTAARLAGAAEAGLINTSDLAGLVEAQELIMRAILEQQIIDLEAGREPTALVELRHLTRFQRLSLKRALKLVALLDVIVKNALLA